MMARRSGARQGDLVPAEGESSMIASADNSSGSGAARTPITVERITVALIPKAGKDLQSLQDRTGLSKTDIANRAITLYEFIDGQLREGREVLIRDSKTGATSTVVIL
jgi:hypothetical protein